MVTEYTPESIWYWLLFLGHITKIYQRIELYNTIITVVNLNVPLEGLTSNNIHHGILSPDDEYGDACINFYLKPMKFTYILNNLFSLIEGVIWLLHWADRRTIY